MKLNPTLNKKRNSSLPWRNISHNLKNKQEIEMQPVNFLKRLQTKNNIQKLPKKIASHNIMSLKWMWMKRVKRRMTPEVLTFKVKNII